jgi:hypothetical protein
MTARDVRRVLALTVSGAAAIVAIVGLALLTTGRLPSGSGLVAGSASADGAQILLMTVAVVATIVGALALAGPGPSHATPRDGVRR